MSPEATAFLYPHSVVGESPNHSQVNFATPDLQKHPLYKEALLLQQEFVLQVQTYFAYLAHLYLLPASKSGEERNMLLSPHIMAPSNTFSDIAFG